MDAFNNSDHIVVTVAGTGEKKLFLKSQVKAVTPMGADAAATSRLDILCDDNEQIFPVMIDETADDIADLLNGAPDAAQQRAMADKIVAARQAEMNAALDHMDRQYRQPDPVTNTLMQMIERTVARADAMDAAVAKYNADKKASFRLRLVDQLYRAERAEIASTQDDSLVVQILGYGILARVKAHETDVSDAADARARAARYNRSLDMHKAERALQYQKDRERLQRLADDPQMTEHDRGRLAAMIRDYRETHGPAPDFRFIRDARTQSFRPRVEINRELEHERLAQLRERAENIRAARQPVSDDDNQRERARDIADSIRRSRSRDRDFGYER